MAEEIATDNSLIQSAQKSVKQQEEAQKEKAQQKPITTAELIPVESLTDVLKKEKDSVVRFGGDLRTFVSRDFWDDLTTSDRGGLTLSPAAKEAVLSVSDDEGGTVLAKGARRQAAIENPHLNPTNLGRRLFKASQQGKLPPMADLLNKDTSPLTPRERIALKMGQMSFLGEALQDPEKAQQIYEQYNIDPTDPKNPKNIILRQALTTERLRGELENESTIFAKYMDIVTDEAKTAFNPLRTVESLVSGKQFISPARETRVDEQLVAQGARLVMGVAQYAVGAVGLRALGLMAKANPINYAAKTRMGQGVGDFAIKSGIAKNADEAALFTYEVIEDAGIGFVQELNDQIQRNGGLKNIKMKDVLANVAIGSLLGTVQSSVRIRQERKALAKGEGEPSLRDKQETITVPRRDKPLAEAEKVTLDEATAIEKAINQIGERKDVGVEEILQNLQEALPESTFLKEIGDPKEYLEAVEDTFKAIGIHPNSNFEFKKVVGLIGAKLNTFKPKKPTSSTSLDAGTLLSEALKTTVDSNRVVEDMIFGQGLDPGELAIGDIAHRVSNAPEEAPIQGNLFDPPARKIESTELGPASSTIENPRRKIDPDLRINEGDTISMPKIDEEGIRSMTLDEFVNENSNHAGSQFDFDEHREALFRSAEEEGRDPGEIAFGNPNEIKELPPFGTDPDFNVNSILSYNEQGELAGILFHTPIPDNLDLTLATNPTAGGIQSVKLLRAWLERFPSSTRLDLMEVVDSVLQENNISGSSAKMLFRLIKKAQKSGQTNPKILLDDLLKVDQETGAFTKDAKLETVAEETEGQKLISKIAKQIGIALPAPIKPSGVQLMGRFDKADYSTANIISTDLAEPESVLNGQTTPRSLADVNDPAHIAVEEGIQETGSRAVTRDHIKDTVEDSDVVWSNEAENLLNARKETGDISEFRNAIDEEKVSHRVTKPDNPELDAELKARQDGDPFKDLILYHEENGRIYSKDTGIELLDVSDIFKETNPAERFFDDLTKQKIREMRPDLSIEDINAVYGPTFNKILDLYSRTEDRGTLERVIRNFGDQGVNAVVQGNMINHVLAAHGETAIVSSHELKNLTADHKTSIETLSRRAEEAGITLTSVDIAHLDIALTAFRLAHMDPRLIRNMQLNVLREFGIYQEGKANEAGSFNLGTEDLKNPVVRWEADNITAWEGYLQQADHMIKKWVDTNNAIIEHTIRPEGEIRKKDIFSESADEVTEDVKYDGDNSQKPEEGIDLSSLGNKLYIDDLEYVRYQIAKNLAAKSNDYFNRTAEREFLSADPKNDRLYEILTSPTPYVLPDKMVKKFNEAGFNLKSLLEQDLPRNGEFAESALEVVKKYYAKDDAFFENLGEFVNKGSFEFDPNKRISEMVHSLGRGAEQTMRLASHLRLRGGQILDTFKVWTASEYDWTTPVEEIVEGHRFRFNNIRRELRNVFDQYIKLGGTQFKDLGDIRSSILKNHPDIAAKYLELIVKEHQANKTLQLLGANELQAAQKFINLRKRLSGERIVDPETVIDKEGQIDRKAKGARGIEEEFGFAELAPVFDFVSSLDLWATNGFTKAQINTPKNKFSMHQKSLINLFGVRKGLRDKLALIEQDLSVKVQNEMEKVLQDRKRFSKFDNLSKLRDEVQKQFKDDLKDLEVTKKDLKKSEEDLDRLGYTTEQQKKIQAFNDKVDQEVAVQLAIIQGHNELLDPKSPFYDPAYHNIVKETAGDAKMPINSTEDVYMWMTIFPFPHQDILKKLNSAKEGFLNLWDQPRQGKFSTTTDLGTGKPSREFKHTYNQFQRIMDTINDKVVPLHLKDYDITATPVKLARQLPEYKEFHTTMLKVPQFQAELNKYYYAGFSKFMALPSKAQERVWHYQQQTTLRNRRYTPEELRMEGLTRDEIDSYFQMRNTFQNLGKFTDEWMDANGIDRETELYKNFKGRLGKEEYAPLLRQGRYAVRGIDKKTGTVEIFMTFDTTHEADSFILQMAADEPNIEFAGEQRINGISPATLEKARMDNGVIDMQSVMNTYENVNLMGLIDVVENSKAFTDAERDIFRQFATSTIGRKTAHGALGPRNNVGGFTNQGLKDVDHFVKGISRSLPKKLLADEMFNLIENIPNKKGHQDHAKELWDYYRGATKGGSDNSVVRGIAKSVYAFSLAFKPAFMMLNLTQRATMTFAESLKYGNGLAVAANTRGQIGELGLYRNYSKELLGVIHKSAGERSVASKFALGEAIQKTKFVDDADLNLLIRERLLDQWSKGELGIKQFDDFMEGTANKIDSALGFMGQISEGSNRIHATITGTIIADALQKQGKLKQPVGDFVTDFVRETQFVFGKQNRTKLQRTAVGYLGSIFRTFSINYYNWLYHNMFHGVPGGKKAGLASVGMFTAMAGVAAHPLTRLAGYAMEQLTEFFEDPEKENTLPEEVIGDFKELKERNKIFATKDLNDVIALYQDKEVLAGTKMLGDIFINEGIAGVFGADPRTFGFPELIFDKVDLPGLQDDIAQIAGAAGDFGLRVNRMIKELGEEGQAHTTKDKLRIIFNRMSPSQVRGMARAMRDNVILDSRNRPLISEQDIANFPKDLKPLLDEYVKEANRISNSMSITDQMLNLGGFVPKKFSRYHEINFKITETIDKVNNAKSELRNMVIDARINGDVEKLKEAEKLSKHLGLYEYMTSDATAKVIQNRVELKRKNQAKQSDIKERILEE